MACCWLSGDSGEQRWPGPGAFAAGFLDNAGHGLRCRACGRGRRCGRPGLIRRPRLFVPGRSGREFVRRRCLSCAPVAGRFFFDRSRHGVDQHETGLGARHRGDHLQVVIRMVRRRGLSSVVVALGFDCAMKISSTRIDIGASGNHVNADSHAKGSIVAKLLIRVLGFRQVAVGDFLGESLPRRRLAHRMQRFPRADCHLGEFRVLGSHSPVRS